MLGNISLLSKNLFIKNLLGRNTFTHKVICLIQLRNSMSCLRYGKNKEYLLHVITVILKGHILIRTLKKMIVVWLKTNYTHTYYSLFSDGHNETV